MDEKTSKQLTKQLKILNFWISIYGTLILIVLIFLTFMIFRVVTYVNNLNDKVRSSLDVKTKVCSSEGALGSILKNQLGCERIQLTTFATFQKES